METPIFRGDGLEIRSTNEDWRRQAIRGWHRMESVVAFCQVWVRALIPELYLSGVGCHRCVTKWEIVHAELLV